MKKNVLSVRVVNPRSSFPGEAVEHVSLEIFKNQLAKAMGNTG